MTREEIVTAVRQCGMSAGGVRSGAGQPAGVVRRDHNHNGAAAGLRGGVKGESI